VSILLNFISENIGSLIVGIIVFAIIILALIKVIRDKRSLSCSCGGNCSGCAGCGTCDMSNNNGDGSIKSLDIKIKRINENSRSD